MHFCARKNYGSYFYLFIYLFIYSFVCLFTGISPPKEGEPSEDELEELSEMLELSWEKLARRLGFHRGEITGFDKANEELSKKAFKRL